MSVAFEGAVASPILGASRVIRIYLPPSYSAAPRRRFPVLYIQDGQNAFTTAGDHVAYDWGCRRVSCVLCVLAAEGDLRIGAQHNPEMAQLYLALEVEM